MAYRRSFDQAQAQGPPYHRAASEARCFCRNWGAATAGERCGGDHAERRPELGRCTPLNLAGFRSGWLAHSPVQHVQATFVPFGVEQGEWQGMSTTQQAVTIEAILAAYDVYYCTWLPGYEAAFAVPCTRGFAPRRAAYPCCFRQQGRSRQEDLSEGTT